VQMRDIREPRLDHLDPSVVPRVLLTISCGDSDAVPKVHNAGDVLDHESGQVQVMHNGVLVERGGYFGPWTDEIIYALRGHHEPQEELAFHTVIERLKRDGAELMVELGSFWAYYGMWFAHAIPGSQVIAMEPDDAFMDVGRRNVALNHMEDRVTFVRGAIGPNPGANMSFEAASDGQFHEVPTHDLESLLASCGRDRADLVLADIQGAETVLLQRAVPLLRAGRIRFLVVSTHHFTISGSAVTHQSALKLLRDEGAHIIAEHTVTESFSGDGLIVASFDPRDRDLHVSMSHARAQDCLFGGLEWELELARAERARAVRSAAVAERRAARASRAQEKAERQLARARKARDSASRKLAVAVEGRRSANARIKRMESSRSWRIARRGVATAQALRSVVGRAGKG
jgi:FkbM family methyltransferase